MGGEVKGFLPAMLVVLSTWCHASTPTPTPIVLTDAFGYTASNDPFAWVDISGTGTPILPVMWTGNADDGSYVFNLPFNFRFYGVPYNKVSITSNGYLEFGNSSAAYGVDCLNTHQTPDSIAALYWMDLDPGAGGAVYTEVLGVPGSRIAVIQFQAVLPRVGVGSVTAEFLLYEGSNDLLAQYASTGSSGSGVDAVAGLRSKFDCPNRTSLPLSCQVADLVDGLAVRYAYPLIEPGCGTPTITPTWSVSPTYSQSPTISQTWTVSPTDTATPSTTPSWTASPSFTLTPSFSSTPSFSVSPTPSLTPSASATFSVTPSESFSPTPTVTQTVVFLSDVFGYTAASAAFAWEDIVATGLSITAWTPNNDDGSFVIDLPSGFNFKFYGNSYTKVAVATNGYFQFGSSSSNFGNSCPAALGTPANIAALFWMDLKPSLGGAVYHEVRGLAPSRRLIVQFEAVPDQAATGTFTGQAVFYESSQGMSMRWKDTGTLGSGAAAATGLRSLNDCPNRTGLTLTCNQPLLSSLSQVDFTYPVPEPVCGTPTFTPTGTLTASPSFSPTLTPSASHTDTTTVTPSATPSFSASPSYSDSPTATQTSTLTQSWTPSPSFSVSPTISLTPTISPTFSMSPTESPTYSVSPTPTESPSITETLSVSPTFSTSPTDSPSPTISPTWSVSPSFTRSVTPSLTPSATLSWSASPSFSVSPTITPSFSRSPTPTVTLSRTQSHTHSPTFTGTETATFSTSPTFSHSPTSTVTPTSTSTPWPFAPIPACLALGQASLYAVVGGATSASKLSLPAGVAVDTRFSPYRVYVADTGNHRVLFWNSAASLTMGGPADGVIGQANFTAFAANRGGTPGPETLNAPRAVAVALSDGALWVADAGNHRVLRYAYPTLATGTLANKVLGQGGSFSANIANNGGISAGSLNGPTDVSVDPFAGNGMVVADAGNHRVLRFTDLSAAAPLADTVWGQDGVFTSALDNFGLLSSSAGSLSGPQGVHLDPASLWVADTGNHRLLRFAVAPSLQMDASIVLGQADFGTHLGNRGGAFAGQNTLLSPADVSMDGGGRLLAVDAGNHRVLAWDSGWTDNANLLYGQPAYNSASPGVNDNVFDQPRSVDAAVGGSLFVADSANLRVLAYGCGNGVALATATASFTVTATRTPTITVSPTRSPTPSITASFSITPSFSVSPTRSITPTMTQTSTLSPTLSNTGTVTVSPTISMTPTLTYTLTQLPSETPYPHPTDKVLSYPNPADRQNPRTCLAFPAGNSARLWVYDLLGQPVAELSGAALNPVAGFACWGLQGSDGSVLAPGIYYVRALVDGQTFMGKFTVY